MFFFRGVLDTPFLQSRLLWGYWLFLSWRHLKKTVNARGGFLRTAFIYREADPSKGTRLLEIPSPGVSSTGRDWPLAQEQREADTTVRQALSQPLMAPIYSKSLWILPQKHLLPPDPHPLKWPTFPLPLLTWCGSAQIPDKKFPRSADDSVGGAHASSPEDLGFVIKSHIEERQFLRVALWPPHMWHTHE